MLVLSWLLALLAYQAYESPLEPLWGRGLLRLDSLAIFCILLGLGATASELYLRERPPLLRLLLGAALLVLGYATTHVLLMALALSGATLLLWSAEYRERRTQNSEQGSALQTAVPRSWFSRLSADLIGTVVVPCSTLIAGSVLLWLNSGTWRYNATTAGTGLNSISFALLALATLFGARLLPQEADVRRQKAAGHDLAACAPSLAPGVLLLHAAWFFPLFRLFSFGPWNDGWSAALLVLGSALALWALVEELLRVPIVARKVQTPVLPLRFYGALALLGLGLASGAGVGLACFALLSALVLTLGAQALGARAARWPRWPLSGAVPLTLPFITLWIGVGAAAAAGSSALSILVWVLGLVYVLHWLRGGSAASAPPSIPIPAQEPRARNAEPGTSEREQLVEERLQDVPTPSHLVDDGDTRTTPLLNVAVGLSVALGIIAPLLVTALVQPIIAQLQGGLTPYGDLVLWPWVGLQVLDAARTPVAALPSLALLALMLVMGALAWLLLRAFTLVQRG
jgi:hypothetical protein